MTEPLLREYRPADVPVLISLWCRVFGDPEALPACFFRLLPEMGSGVVAELEGELAGAAYIVDGLELVHADGTSHRCAYLYAVAVDERFRGLGLGAAVTRAASELGRERGADIICTLPADRGLYAFYEKQISVRCALRRDRRTLPAHPGAPLVALDAADYLRRREALLQGRCHQRLSPAAMTFEQNNCELSGGGLFAAGDGLAAAYQTDGRCVIRELLSPDPAVRETLAAAVGHALRCAQVVLYSPALAGEPYLAAPPGRIPSDCVWNLAFD